MCCRLCLDTSKKQLEIFDIPELPEMLQKLYKLEISPSDLCSTSICVDCYYEAKESCNWLRVQRKLKQQFEANQAIFEQELDRQEAFPHKVPAAVKNVKIYCKICGVIWKTKKLLRKHLNQQHKIPPELLKGGQGIAIQEEPLRCEICSKFFPEPSLLHHKFIVHMIRAGQPSHPVSDRQPVKKVYHSRATRALENYPVETKPSTWFTRRRNTISSPAVELLASQSPALRTRAKSQDLGNIRPEKREESTTRTRPKTKTYTYEFMCIDCSFSSGKKDRIVRHLSTVHNVLDPTEHFHTRKTVVERVPPTLPALQ